MCTQKKFLLRVERFISRICLGTGPFNTSQFDKKLSRFDTFINQFDRVNK